MLEKLLNKNRSLLLIVDDVPAHIKLYEKLLNDQRWEIQFSQSEKDAEELIKQGKLKPSTVIINSAMICGSDFTLARSIKENTEAPVLVIEHSSMNESALRQYVELGVDDFMLYPKNSKENFGCKQRIERAMYTL